MCQVTMKPLQLCLKHASLLSATSLSLRTGQFTLRPCSLSSWFLPLSRHHTKPACLRTHFTAMFKTNRVPIVSWLPCKIEHRTLSFLSGLKLCPAWYCHHAKRQFHSRESAAASQKKERTSMVLYISAVGVFMVGMAYAGVPLYQMFCQAVGLGGQAKEGHDSSMVETMAPVKNRIIRVRFNADITASMQWNFRPEQPEVRVAPGETALAFYKARNPTDKAIIGISTYNVLPYAAGPYFNKIQCFCFEEQRLNPKEEVDMPVFFFIDPEFTKDPALEGVDQITLSYTFFEAKEGQEIPLPGFMRSG